MIAVACEYFTPWSRQEHVTQDDDSLLLHVFVDVSRTEVRLPRVALRRVCRQQRAALVARIGRTSRSRI